MAPPPRRPPELLEEIIEEVLLRFPPDDPVSLLRAALVCKPWCRLISGRRFRRLYREFHRSPPMLGLFHQNSAGHHRFMPTSSFRIPRVDRTNLCAMDALHGRIIFHATSFIRECPGQPVRMVEDLVVSNPITGEERRLPRPRISDHVDWNVAVVCAAEGCDHVDCPGEGPFTVVFVSTHKSLQLTSACTFSSRTGTWSETISVDHPEGCVMRHRSALLGNVLYFHLALSTQILEYDLGRQKLSMISPPSLSLKVWATSIIVMDSRLGFAVLEESKLNILSRLSREAGRSGDAEWAQQRVFELDNLLPIGALSVTPHLCGTVDGGSVICIATRHGLFAIDLKFGQVTKLSEHYRTYYCVPYMSFCTPASRCLQERGMSYGCKKWQQTRQTRC